MIFILLFITVAISYYIIDLVTELTYLVIFKLVKNINSKITEMVLSIMMNGLKEELKFSLLILTFGLK